MGRMLTITDSNETKTGVKKKTLKKDLIVGPNAIKFVAVLVFAILALLYLTSATQGANRGLEISTLNNQVTDLELQKERLEAEKYRLKSLTEIEAEITKPELEPVSSVEHIEYSDSSLARN